MKEKAEVRGISPTFQELVPSHRFCVAPMMEYTDRHCRYLFRLLSRRAYLYSEMVTAVALARGRSPVRFLDFSPAEHPVALQLGGGNPAELAEAAKMAEDWGYDEVNLNIGCPSDKVTSGRFGACLMAEPDLVAECVNAMQTAVAVPVTVKTRIGIDDMDDAHHLDTFVDKVAAGGCRTFVIHARKAWLQGLSPKENREIPPLDYDRVFQLKQRFPQLEIILNGGLRSLEDALTILTPKDRTRLDGVMMGRMAYQIPYMLADVDQHLYGETAPCPDRAEIVAEYVDYAGSAISEGARAHHVFRHLVGLFYGCSGARQWRQTVTRIGQKGGDPAHLIDLARDLQCRAPIAA